VRTAFPATLPVTLTWANRRPPSPPPPADLGIVRRGTADHLLISGDNLAGLSALQDMVAGGVTLAYLDPPFFTGRVHERVERSRDLRGNLVRSTRPAFDDRWAGLAEYLEDVSDRIAAVRTLLAPHGSLVLHVDPKTSHYFKVICDEIFGPDCFASEIVWRYRRWPAKTANFQRVHDVLLRYCKDARVPSRFNPQYEPLAQSTLATWGTKKQRAVVGEDGRRLRSSVTEEASPGVPMGDVWEIGIVAPVAKERTGYPTQKPAALLKRLVESLTDPKEIVLDPYLGSGTTAAVACELGRRSIGIDKNEESIEIARSRLNALGVRPMLKQVLTESSAAVALDRALLA